jgi:hypothetical protein
MDNMEAFDMDEIKAFPQKDAGEALGKWVRTSEEERFDKEKKELLAERRQLAEYCKTIVEEVEEKIIAKLQAKHRPKDWETLLCSKWTSVNRGPIVHRHKIMRRC